jgi:hypothetical protein
MLGVRTQREAYGGDGEVLKRDLSSFLPVVPVVEDEKVDKRGKVCLLMELRVCAVF